jgi:hypothetical protein
MPTLTADSDIPVSFEVSATVRPCSFTHSIGRRWRSGSVASSRAMSRFAMAASWSDASTANASSSSGSLSASRPGAPAHEVDQLVLRDRVHPRRERLAVVVGVALVVHGDQRFLDQVLDVVGPARQAPAIVAAEHARELAKAALVRAAVAALRGEPRRAQPFLEADHLPEFL